MSGDRPDAELDAGFDAELDAESRANAPAGADCAHSTPSTDLHTSSSVIAGALDLITDGPERPGVTIGRYKLLGVIGQGGFGTVFRAEQQQPVRRLVALKLLRLGMGSRQVVARFEAERQALAIMDHPGIAKVFDAGTTLEGRPFFAMELVDGTPITGWCDEHRLGIEQRIELFRQVCAAVQHAHQKGVIHRDLKPSNILVCEGDDGPLAKVIDFGIAKAISPAVGSTAVTAEPQVLGTYEYMSPEQSEALLDIDTRTDVYSLAAVLYELLTGATPLPSTALRERGIVERARAIRDDEPQPLGPRLLAEPTRDAIAAARSTDAPHLAQRLSGDLTWITLRGLEKDRTRRYESPSALAADLGRSLHHQPVEAAPPSRRYRFGKFARRHRTGLAISTAILVMLATTAAAMTVSAARARRAEGHALQRLGQFEEISTYFIDDLLDAATPSTPRTRDTTMREVLDESARTVGSIQDPLVRSTVRQAIGRTYRRLGLHEAALPMLQKALAERRTLGESEHDVGTSLHFVGMTLEDLKWPDEAGSHLREALELRRRVDGPESTEVAETIAALAMHDQLAGRMAEAERGYRESIAMYRLHDDPTARKDLASVLYLLGLLLADAKRDQEAITLYQQSLQMRDAELGEDHYMTAQTMAALGGMLIGSGQDPIEGERLVARALEIRRAIFPADHSIIASSLVSMGLLHSAAARFEQAIADFEEAAAIYTNWYKNKDHLHVVTAVQGVAKALEGLGRGQEALAKHNQAVESLARSETPTPWRTAHARGLRGACLLGLGEYEQAEADLTAAYDVLIVQTPARADKPAEDMARLCDATNRREHAKQWRAKAAAVNFEESKRSPRD